MSTLDDLPLVSPQRLTSTKARLSKLLAREREIQVDSQRNKQRGSTESSWSTLKGAERPISQKSTKIPDISYNSGSVAPFRDPEDPHLAHAAKEDALQQHALTSEYMPHVIDAGGLEVISERIHILQQSICAHGQARTAEKASNTSISYNPDGRAHMDCLNQLLLENQRRCFAGLGVSHLQLWHTNKAEHIVSGSSTIDFFVDSGPYAPFRDEMGSSLEKFPDKCSGVGEAGALWSTRVDGLRVSLSPESAMLLLRKDSFHPIRSGVSSQDAHPVGPVYSLRPDHPLWETVERAMRAVALGESAKGREKGTGLTSALPERLAWHNILVAYVHDVSSASHAERPMAVLLAVEAVTVASTAFNALKPTSFNAVSHEAFQFSNALGGVEEPAGTGKENLSDNYVHHTSHVPQLNSSRRILQSNNARIKTIFAQQCMQRLCEALQRNLSDMHASALARKIQLQSLGQRRQEHALQSAVTLTRKLGKLYSASYSHNRLSNATDICHGYLLAVLAREVAAHISTIGAEGACLMDLSTVHTFRLQYDPEWPETEADWEDIHSACLPSELLASTILGPLASVAIGSTCVITSTLDELQRARLIRPSPMQATPLFESASISDTDLMISFGGKRYPRHQSVSVVGTRAAIGAANASCLLFMASVSIDELETRMLITLVNELTKVVQEAAERCVHAVQSLWASNLARAPTSALQEILRLRPNSGMQTASLSSACQTRRFIMQHSHQPLLTLAQALSARKVTSLLGCQQTELLLTQSAIQATRTEEDSESDTEPELVSKLYRIGKLQCWHAAGQPLLMESPWVQDLQAGRLIVVHGLGDEETAPKQLSYAVHPRTGLTMHEFERGHGCHAQIAAVLQTTARSTPVDRLTDGARVMQSSSAVLIPLFSNKGAWMGVFVLRFAAMHSNAVQLQAAQHTELISRGCLQNDLEALLSTALEQTCAHVRGEQNRELRARCSALMGRTASLHRDRSRRIALNAWLRAFSERQKAEAERVNSLLRTSMLEWLALAKLTTSQGPNGARSIHQRFALDLLKRTRQLFPGEAVSAEMGSDGYKQPTSTARAAHTSSSPPNEKVLTDVRHDVTWLDANELVCLYESEGPEVHPATMEDSTNMRSLRGPASLVGFVRVPFCSSLGDSSRSSLPVTGSSFKSTSHSPGQVAAVVRIVRGRGMARFSSVCIHALSEFCLIASKVYEHITMAAAQEITLARLAQLLPVMFSTLSLREPIDDATAAAATTPLSDTLTLTSLLPQVAMAIRDASGADVALLRLSDWQETPLDNAGELLVSSADGDDYATTVTIDSFVDTHESQDTHKGIVLRLHKPSDGPSQAPLPYGEVRLLGLDSHNAAHSTATAAAKLLAYALSQTIALHVQYRGLWETRMKHQQLIWSLQGLLQERVLSQSALEAEKVLLGANARAAAGLLQWVRAGVVDHINTLVRLAKYLEATLPKLLAPADGAYEVRLLVQREFFKSLHTSASAESAELTSEDDEDFKEDEASQVMGLAGTIHLHGTGSSAGMVEELDFSCAYRVVSVSIDEKYPETGRGRIDEPVDAKKNSYVSYSRLASIPDFTHNPAAAQTKVLLTSSGGIQTIPAPKGDLLGERPIAALLITRATESMTLAERDASVTIPSNHFASDPNMFQNAVRGVVLSALHRIQQHRELKHLQRNVSRLSEAAALRDRYHTRVVELTDEVQEMSLKSHRMVRQLEDAAALQQRAYQDKQTELTLLQAEKTQDAQTAENRADRLRDQILVLENDLFTSRHLLADSTQRVSQLVNLVGSFTADPRWREGSAAQWLRELADSKDLMVLTVAQTVKGTLLGGGGIRGIMAAAGEALRTSQPMQIFSNLAPLTDVLNNRPSASATATRLLGASVLCVPNRCISAYQAIDTAVFVFYRPAADKDEAPFGPAEIEYWDMAVNLVSRQMLKVSSAPDAEEHQQLQKQLRQQLQARTNYRRIVQLHSAICNRRNGGVTSDAAELSRLIERATADLLNARYAPAADSCEAETFLWMLPWTDDRAAVISGQSNTGQMSLGHALRSGDYSGVYGLLAPYGLSSEAATVQKVLLSMRTARHGTAVWIPLSAANASPSLASVASDKLANEDSSAKVIEGSILALLRVQRKFVAGISHNATFGPMLEDDDSFSKLAPVIAGSASGAPLMSPISPRVEELFISEDEEEVLSQLLCLLSPLLAHSSAVSTANLNIRRASAAIVHLEEEILAVREQALAEKASRAQVQLTLQCGVDILSALRSNRAQWGAQLDVARRCIMSVTHSDECFIILPGSTGAFTHATMHRAETSADNLTAHESAERRVVADHSAYSDSSGSYAFPNDDSPDRFFTLSPDQDTAINVRFEEGDLELAALRNRRPVLAAPGSAYGSVDANPSSSNTANDTSASGAWRSWGSRRLLSYPPLGHGVNSVGPTSRGISAAGVSACIVPFAVRSGVIPRDSNAQAVVTVLRCPGTTASGTAAGAASLSGASADLSRPAKHAHNTAAPRFSEVDVSCVEYICRLLSYCLEVYSGSTEGLQEARLRIAAMAREMQRLRESAQYALTLELDNEALEQDLCAVSSLQDYTNTSMGSSKHAELRPEHNLDAAQVPLDLAAVISSHQSDLGSEGETSAVLSTTRILFAEAKLVEDPALVREAVAELARRPTGTVDSSKKLARSESELEQDVRNKFASRNNSTSATAYITGSVQATTGQVTYWTVHQRPRAHVEGISDPFSVASTQKPIYRLYLHIQHQGFGSLYVCTEVNATVGAIDGDTGLGSPAGSALINIRLRLALLLRLLDSTAAWRSRFARVARGGSNLLITSKTWQQSQAFSDKCIHAALSASRTITQAFRSSRSARKGLCLHESDTTNAHEADENLQKFVAHVFQKFGTDIGCEVTFGVWRGDAIGHENVHINNNARTVNSISAVLASAIPEAPASQRPSQAKSIASSPTRRVLVLQKLTEANGRSVSVANVETSIDEASVSTPFKYAAATERAIVAALLETDDGSEEAGRQAIPSATGVAGSMAPAAILAATQLLRGSSAGGAAPIAVTCHAARDVPHCSVLVPIRLPSRRGLQIVVLIRPPAFELHPAVDIVHHKRTELSSLTALLAACVSTEENLSHAVVAHDALATKVRMARRASLRAAMHVGRLPRIVARYRLALAFKHLHLQTRGKMAADTLQQGRQLQRLELALTSWLRLHSQLNAAVVSAHGDDQHQEMPSTVGRLWAHACVPLLALLSEEDEDQETEHFRESSLRVQVCALCVAHPEGSQKGMTSSFSSIIDYEISRLASSQALGTSDGTPRTTPVIVERSADMLGSQVSGRVSHMLSGKESVRDAAHGLYRLQRTQIMQNNTPAVVQHMWLVPVICANRTVCVLRLLLERPTQVTGHHDGNKAVVSEMGDVWLDVLQALRPMEERLLSRVCRFLDMVAPFFYAAASSHALHALHQRTHNALQVSKHEHLLAQHHLRHAQDYARVTSALDRCCAAYLTMFNSSGSADSVNTVASMSTANSVTGNASASTPVHTNLGKALPSLLSKLSDTLGGRVTLALYEPAVVLRVDADASASTILEGETEAASSTVFITPEGIPAPLAPVSIHRTLRTTSFTVIGRLTVTVDATTASRPSPDFASGETYAMPLLAAALQSAQREGQSSGLTKHSVNEPMDFSFASAEAVGHLLMDQLATLLTGILVALDVTTQLTRTRAENEQSISELCNDVLRATQSQEVAQTAAVRHETAARFYLHLTSLIQKCLNYLASTPLLRELCTTTARVEYRNSSIRADPEASARDNNIRAGGNARGGIAIRPASAVADVSSRGSEFSSDPSLAALLATLCAQLPVMVGCSCIFSFAETVPVADNKKPGQHSSIESVPSAENSGFGLRWHYHDTASHIPATALAPDDNPSEEPLNRNYRGQPISLLSAGALDDHTLVTAHNMAHDCARQHLTSDAAVGAGNSSLMAIMDIAVPQSRAHRSKGLRARGLGSAAVAAAAAAVTETYTFGARAGIRVLSFPLLAPAAATEPEDEAAQEVTYGTTGRVVGVLQVLVDIATVLSDKLPMSTEQVGSGLRNETPLQEHERFQDLYEICEVAATAAANLMWDSRQRTLLSTAVVNLERDVRSLANKAVEYQGKYLTHQSQGRLWHALNMLSMCISSGKDVKDLERSSRSGNNTEPLASEDTLRALSLLEVLDAPGVNRLLQRVGVEIIISDHEDIPDEVVSLPERVSEAISQLKPPEKTPAPAAVQPSPIEASQSPESRFEVVLKLTRKDGSSRELRIGATDDAFAIARDYVASENESIRMSGVSGTALINDAAIPKLAAMIEQRREKAYSERLLRKELAAEAALSPPPPISPRPPSPSPSMQDRATVAYQHVSAKADETSLVVTAQGHAEALTTKVRYERNVALKEVARWARLRLTTSADTVDVDSQIANEALDTLHTMLVTASSRSVLQDEFDAQARENALEARRWSERYARLRSAFADERGVVWQVLARLQVSRAPLLSLVQAANKHAEIAAVDNARAALLDVDSSGAEDDISLQQVLPTLAAVLEATAKMLGAAMGAQPTSVNVAMASHKTSPESRSSSARVASSTGNASLALPALQCLDVTHGLTLQDSSIGSQQSSPPRRERSSRSPTRAAQTAPQADTQRGMSIGRFHLSVLAVHTSAGADTEVQKCSVRVVTRQPAAAWDDKQGAGATASAPAEFPLLESPASTSVGRSKVGPLKEASSAVRKCLQTSGVIRACASLEAYGMNCGDMLERTVLPVATDRSSLVGGAGTGESLASSVGSSDHSDEEATEPATMLPLDPLDGFGVFAPEGLHAFALALKSLQPHCTTLASHCVQLPMHQVSPTSVSQDANAGRHSQPHTSTHYVLRVIYAYSAVRSNDPDSPDGGKEKVPADFDGQDLLQHIVSPVLNAAAALGTSLFTIFATNNAFAVAQNGLEHSYLTLQAAHTQAVRLPQLVLREVSKRFSPMHVLRALDKQRRRGGVAAKLSATDMTAISAYPPPVIFLRRALRERCETVLQALQALVRGSALGLVLALDIAPPGTTIDIGSRDRMPTEHEQSFTMCDYRVVSIGNPSMLCWASLLPDDGDEAFYALSDPHATRVRFQESEKEQHEHGKNLNQPTGAGSGLHGITEPAGVIRERSTESGILRTVLRTARTIAVPDLTSSAMYDPEMDGEVGVQAAAAVEDVAGPVPLAAMYVPLLVSDVTTEMPGTGPTNAKARNAAHASVGAVAIIVRPGTPFSAHEVTAAEWCAQCGAAGVFTIASILRSRDLVSYLHSRDMKPEAASSRSRSLSPPRSGDSVGSISAPRVNQAAETPEVLRTRRVEGRRRVSRKNSATSASADTQEHAEDSSSDDDDAGLTQAAAFESDERMASAELFQPLRRVAVPSSSLPNTSRLLNPTVATASRGVRNPAEASLTAARSYRSTKGNWRQEAAWDEEEEEEEE